MQFFIGLISGCVSIVLGLVVLSLSVSPLATFFIGWLLGMVLSSILLQLVTSTVQTVVVYFAEAPSELQHNYRRVDDGIFYDSCQDRCQKVLGFMLCGLTDQ
jgi:hypothetical protein